MGRKKVSGYQLTLDMDGITQEELDKVIAKEAWEKKKNGSNKYLDRLDKIKRIH